MHTANHSHMKNEMNNTIFSYALVGALLFTATFWYVITNLHGLAALQATDALIAGTLAATTVGLLYKAIKADRYRDMDMGQE